MLQVSHVFFVFVFSFTEFPNIDADQSERLANWQIPQTKKSGGYKHSTLSKKKIFLCNQYS